MQIRMDEKGRILFMATTLFLIFTVSMRDLWSCWKKLN